MEPLKKTFQEEIDADDEVTIFDDRDKYIKVQSHTQENPSVMAYRKFQHSEARENVKCELKPENDSVTISFNGFKRRGSVKKHSYGESQMNTRVQYSRAEFFGLKNER